MLLPLIKCDKVYPSKYCDIARQRLDKLPDECLDLVARKQSARQWTGEIAIAWIIFCVVCAT
jgi:hypothetical protein